MPKTLAAGRFTHWLARTILRLSSWQLRLELPSAPKYIMVGAPHTSNLDFIYALLIAHAAGLKLHWIGKHTLFRWPFGGLFRWLGGIPVDRRSSQNFVAQVVHYFESASQLVIAIAPEGTRGAAAYWKTGFYYIALGAGVPIALGFIDYRTRTLGIGSSLIPTGDLPADFARIQAFYAPLRGRHPHRQGDIQLRAG